MANPASRYFVVKSYNFQGLVKAKESSEWACSERKTGPQTWKILAKAFSKSRVVLIFSVNNCHGYHGYAHMKSAPSEQTEGLNLAADGGGELTEWHRFGIVWERLFLEEHGEQCLQFSKTAHLGCSDGSVLNKARNFQEVGEVVGVAVCELMDAEYSRLSALKHSRLQAREARLPPPFLTATGAVAAADWDGLWAPVLDRVSQLGHVVVACAFGSQRYNCHGEHSDIDMFIVYQAPSHKLLGFQPPSHTIKNREKEQLDYTILELHRFCELLLAGDPRCTETLFLDSSSIYYQSPMYTQICSWKQHLLTRSCMEKYLHDACGAKGMRLLDKWVKSGDALSEPIPKKVGKLFYIIIRLLQNARDICEKRTLVVYRQADSEDRQLLMQARGCELPYSTLRETVDRLEEHVRGCVGEADQRQAVEQSVRSEVEEWLLRARYTSLQQHLNTSSTQEEQRQVTQPLNPTVQGEQVTQPLNPTVQGQQQQANTSSQDT